MKKSAILALALALGVTSSALAAEVIKDKLEINGEVRAKYLSQKASLNDGVGYESDLRTRLEFVYKPFEDWQIVAMVENQHDLREKRGARHHDVVLKQAYIQGKYDQMDITIGRVGVGLADGYVLDDDLERTDSVTLGHQISDKFNIEAFAAQNLDGREMEYEGTRSKMAGGRLTYTPAEGTEAKAEYATFRNINTEDSAGEVNTRFNILALSASHEVAKDLTASLTYMRGSVSGNDDLKETSKNGYVAGLSYRGAEPEKKGTWGLSANYYNQGRQTFVAHALDGNVFEDDGGFKGWSVGAEFTVAKNVVVDAAYYDTKAKEGSDKDHRIWSQIKWTF